MKVLIIDDEEDIRLIAEFGLSKIGGWEVVMAESGHSGIQVADREAPDVILLDYRMPDMDGLDTFHQLRKQSTTASTPVVFLTASVSASELNTLKTLGATGIIAKPFDPISLSDQLKTLLNQ